jgi:hypothetical protein
MNHYTFEQYKDMDRQQELQDFFKASSKKQK